MKLVFLLTGFILLINTSKSQNLDSILAEPQTLEFIISTPQPRLDETFQLSLDINHLRANIFKSLAGKVQSVNDFGHLNNGMLVMNVTAVNMGKNEIGPLEFFLDKTKYTTDKITFEVIEALPATDRGIWFRKVVTGDTTFCIIIEQRIPASSQVTKTSANSTTFSTVPEYPEILKFKDTYSIEGLSGSNSNTYSSYSSITIDGEERQFMYGYSVYHFRIEDRKAKIEITKDKFQNIPKDYKFEPIKIQ